MKKTLLVAILFGLVGCGTDNSTKVPNNKKYIIQNTERIELLEPTKYTFIKVSV